MEFLLEYLPDLLNGFILTVEITIFGVFIGLALGILLAIGDLYWGRAISTIIRLYVEFFRGSPIITQLFIFYFTIPSLLHILIDPYIAGLLVFSLNSAAYQKGYIKGAMESVYEDQIIPYTGNELSEANCKRLSGGSKMISLRDIKDARETMGNLVERTPLMRSHFLSNFCGGEVYLKLENLQITNSFKIRGALNKMLHLSIKEMERGVVTASTGNHAQAVAIGAEKLNLSAKIVIPRNTSKVKIEKIKKHDVELILYGDYNQAEKRAIDLATKDGLTYISPYNDKRIIAGQGTIGLEIIEDLSSVDTVIVPVGGGGLISGISLAVKSIKPSVQIIGVQSEASPVMYESLKAGKIVDVELRESIADGLFGDVEKESVTLGIVQKYVNDLLLVKEETIRKAIYLLWNKEKQVVEGSGAIAIAPIIEDKRLFIGKTIVAVISGGNIEEELFRNVLASETNELSTEENF